MAIFVSLLLAAAAGGATYVYAKKKKVAEGTSIGVSVLTGAATYAFWPLMLLGGAAIYLGRRYMDQQKALPPGS